MNTEPDEMRTAFVRLADNSGMGSVGRRPEKQRFAKMPIMRGEIVTGTHTVVDGDTLWRLAQRYYHKARLFPVLAAANHISDPKDLPIGKVLTIPDLGSAQTHEVVGGDELGKLADQFYGDAGKWKVIANANGVKDPRALPVGQLLWIPDLTIDSTVYKNHSIERVARGGTIELVMDGTVVSYGRLPDGTYALRDYAYDRSPHLVDVAKRWIDYQSH